MRKWTFATVCSLAMAFGCHSKQPPARPSTQPAASTAPTNRSESTSTSTMADSVVLFAVVAQPPQAGPDDIRNILVTDSGFLSATGAGIVRYEVKGGVPMASSQYAARDGLPSSNCFVLKLDAKGGVWAQCDNGVGYLAKGSAKWQGFTEKNALAPGPVTAVESVAGGGSGMGDYRRRAGHGEHRGPYVEAFRRHESHRHLRASHPKYRLVPAEAIGQEYRRLRLAHVAVRSGHGDLEGHPE